MGPACPVACAALVALGQQGSAQGGTKEPELAAQAWGCWEVRTSSQLRRNMQARRRFPPSRGASSEHRLQDNSGHHRSLPSQPALESGSCPAHHFFAWPAPACRSNSDGDTMVRRRPSRSARSSQAGQKQTCTCGGSQAGIIRNLFRGSSMRSCTQLLLPEQHPGVRHVRRSARHAWLGPCQHLHLPHTRQTLSQRQTAHSSKHNKQRGKRATQTPHSP